MSQFTSVRLPVALNSLGPEVCASESMDTEEFEARQVEFVQAVFGYAAFLTENARETPVADAFLATLVNLLETMQANAPGEASACALRLQQVIGVIFPRTEFDASSSVTDTRKMDRAAKADGHDEAAPP
jgi:hypothetical protein